MVKEFEEAAFGAEPNQVVGPVKTAYGYHVIQVLEKFGPHVQPLFEVPPAIRARLQDQRAAEEARRMAADLMTRVQKIGKPSDEELRRMAGPNVTFNETEYLARSDAPAGLGANPAFGQALFSMPPGGVAGPIDTARGQAILKLVDVKQPGPPAFGEVKERVKADLARKKQEDAAVAALKEALGTRPTWRRSPRSSA